MAIFLNGCTRQLEVRASPNDSLITVKDSSGKIIRTGPSPLLASVDYSSSNPTYIIEAAPSGANAESFVAAPQPLTEAEYGRLPQVPGDERTRALDIKLKKKAPYEDRNTVVIYIDPLTGFHGEVVAQRAYIEVSEQGGAIPTRIQEFDENMAITGIALSPDGQRMVFSATSFAVGDMKELKNFRLDEHRELPISGSNLRGIRTAGGGLQHITDENFQDLFPSFTTDGKHLLFCSNRRRSSSNDILRTTAEGRGGLSNIYLDQRNARAVKPSQSKDGTIAFTIYPETWTRAHDVQIWTIGGPNQFPTQIAIGTDPAISPDGTHIAYIGVDANLWVVNADGSNATQLTGGASKILQRFKESVTGPERAQFDYNESRGALLRVYKPYSFPSWSADGKTLVFSSMEGNDPTGRPNDDIWIMNADGSGREQLTTNGSSDRFPVLSPDGNHCYFYSNRGLHWAVWRIPVKSASNSSSNGVP